MLIGCFIGQNVGTYYVFLSLNDFTCGHPWYVLCALSAQSSEQPSSLRVRKECGKIAAKTRIARFAVRGDLNRRAWQYRRISLYFILNGASSWRIHPPLISVRYNEDRLTINLPSRRNLFLWTWITLRLKSDIGQLTVSNVPPCLSKSAI